MPHVFLSYSTHDIKWVDAFEQLLTSELQKRNPKIKVWQDKNKLRVGDDWNDEIEAAVRSAAFFCLVASGAWAASEPCQNELAVFREDASRKNRIACAITAAADKEHLLDPIPKVHYTKFYRPVQGRNQGKTTFLKRIAMECLQGTLRPDKIPVFIPLKEFSDLQPPMTLPQLYTVQMARSNTNPGLTPRGPRTRSARRLGRSCRSAFHTHSRRHRSIHC